MLEYSKNIKHHKRQAKILWPDAIGNRESQEIFDQRGDIM